MEKSLTPSLVKFEKKYPAVWGAFENLGQKCHEEGGPLDEKTRRLVKLGIALASQHQGAVHSAARQAREAGVSAKEMHHVAILAITTIGWPGAYAGMTWIDDGLGKKK